MPLFYLNEKHRTIDPQAPVIDFSYVNDNLLGCYFSIMLAIFTPLTLLFLLYLGHSIIFNILFWVNSSSSHAVVTHCDYTPAKFEGRWYSGASVQLGYVYQLPVQGEIDGSDELDYVDDVNITCVPFPVGGDIEIKYLLINPYISRVELKPTAPIEELTTNLFMLVPISVLFIFSCRGGLEIIRFFIADRRWLKLNGGGILLEGVITKAECREYPQLKDTNYYVRVEYQFFNPQNTLLKGKHQFPRNDLRDEPLPQPQTVVKILYVNHHCHIVL